ncbi:MAG: sigma 54-interacting transcriptional regulator, partial [Myxococcales bacterium]|nr:sigma 54-interacting transcriptional regulator [Myxococcales bacterium]
MLEDLGSKNGTFVNDARVSSATLEDGDCVRIGNTLLVLRSVATSSCDALDLVAPARPPALATVLPSLARDLDVLARAASAALPMLLTSETGTGKEVLARAIHALSGRRGAFVAVNCGGLPPTLVEGVLFGHRRGAFSGAVADQHGFFRAADGGTLLLDEIG